MVEDVLLDSVGRDRQAGASARVADLGSAAVEADAVSDDGVDGLAAFGAEGEAAEHEVRRGSSAPLGVLYGGRIGSADLVVDPLPQLGVDDLGIGTDAHVVAVLSHEANAAGGEVVAALGQVASPVQLAGHISGRSPRVELGEQHLDDRSRFRVHNGVADDLTIVAEAGLDLVALRCLSPRLPLGSSALDPGLYRLRLALGVLVVPHPADR